MPILGVVVTNLTLANYGMAAVKNDINDEFQTLKRDTDFTANFNKINLEDSSIDFIYKKKGTSVGFKFTTNDIKYKYTPTNSATNVQAQVVSYHLGRFLNIGSLVIPSAYYTLGPVATSKFEILLKKATETGKNKEENRAQIEKLVTEYA